MIRFELFWQPVEMDMRQKNETKLSGKFHFCIPLKRAIFLLTAVQSHPMSLSYVTDISQNYIPLSHPHYIHHTKYVQKVDKPMIYVIVGSEADIRELI